MTVKNITWTSICGRTHRAFLVTFWENWRTFLMKSPIIYTRLSISILYAPFNYLRNRYTTTIFTLRDNASTRKLTPNRIKGTTLTVPEDLKEKWKCEFNERKNKHLTCQLSNISTTFNIISYVSSDDVCMVSFSILWEIVSITFQHTQWYCSCTLTDNSICMIWGEQKMVWSQHAKSPQGATTGLIMEHLVRHFF